MLIYWMLIIFFVLTMFSFWIFKTDIVNPGFVVPFVFFASTCCAIYNKNYWGYEIGDKTFGIMVNGVVVYCITSIIVYRLCIKSTLKKTNQSKEIFNEIDSIHVSIFCIVVLACFQAVSSILYLREVIRIVTSNGGVSGSLAVILNSYKLLTHFQNIDDSISGMVSQMYQVTTVIGNVFIYIVINNFIIERKISKIYSIPVLIYIISSLFSGNRLSILRFAITILVLYFILWHRKNGWNKKIKIATLARIMMLMVIVMMIFVFLRSVVGKAGADADADPVYYIAQYAGGSIPLFDLYVKNPASSSGIFGKESLYYINQFIASKFGISSLDYTFAAEFRSLHGISVGNVYTAFRAYYSDFGYIGMLFCTSIHSLLFSLLYANIRKRTIHKRKLGIDIPLLLFLRMSYSYFFFSINNYTDWLSPNFFKLIVFYYAVVWFVQLEFAKGLKQKRAGEMLNSRMKVNTEYEK